MNKPIEFKIEKTNDNEYGIVFYYENGKINCIEISDIPEGLEIDKHYSISDLYGYKVVDDRKDL